MNQLYQKLNSSFKKSKWPKWVKILIGGLCVVLVLLMVFSLSVIWYVNSHNKEILAKVTDKLNTTLNGKIEIEAMEPTFLKGFPRISLHLKNVVIRDTMYAKHHKTLLRSGDFDIALNVIALMRGTIEIKKIAIRNAAINLFTDANGYTNSSVFKSNAEKGNDSPVFPELHDFELDNVSFTIDNQSKHKLFQFVVHKLRGDMRKVSGGWKSEFRLKTMVNSLAFSTVKGSFIKEKMVEGNFDVLFKKKKAIIILPNNLAIGDEDFTISAEFTKTQSNTVDYAIHIVNDRILWRNASHLLSQNISSRLDKFNLKEPIKVRCDIQGNFDEEGDPFILVNAKIKDNELSTPGGVVSDCNFTGIFTNCQVEGKGFNDANSAVKLDNFKGNYSGVPVHMKHIAILDFEKPFAKGDFKSKFNLKELNNIIDPSLLKFTNGTAEVNLNFDADIVNFMIAKPIVIGTVAVNDGDVEYTKRKLKFTDISVLLDFTEKNLQISNLHLQVGRSILNMEGAVENFLNLYYTAPEKVVLNWKINSPEIQLGEFMRFLNASETVKTTKKKKMNADFTEDINDLIENSKVNVALRVDKLFYNKFLATNVTADMSLANSEIAVKNGSLYNSDGTVKFDGMLSRKGKINDYRINATVSHVNVSNFFYSFDNFGLASLNSKTIKGHLSVQSGLTGKIVEGGKLVPNSTSGKVTFQLKKGALINFDPIRKIGKFAFPHRNMNEILFENLDGKFDIAGEKVKIHPMQVNTSVINMDIDGLYSFGKGTSINITVPLRNPEKDKGITDAAELAERRERGIVVRMMAVDDKDGKVKIKLVSKKTQLAEKKNRKKS